MTGWFLIVVFWGGEAFAERHVDRATCEAWVAAFERLAGDTIQRIACVEHSAKETAVQTALKRSKA